MSSDDRCPITHSPGTLRRVRSGREIAASYRTYHGQAIPDALVEKYFADTIHEYQCESSGLRWYAPALLADSDFYEWLAAVFPWYYSEEPTWDKHVALELLEQTDSRGFVEIGSGGGTFLRMARARGVAGIGTEINEAAIRSCRQEGLEVYHADETPTPAFPLDTIVSIQSLEHVLDPAGYLDAVLARFPVRRMIIAVPCHESLLGHTLDPLAWPPHHYTAWSQKALASLGQRRGFRLESTRRDSLQYAEYRRTEDLERGQPASQLIGLSRFGLLGKAAFKALRGLGVPWAAHRHSIVVVLTRKIA